MHMIDAWMGGWIFIYRYFINTYRKVILKVEICFRTTWVVVENSDSWRYIPIPPQAQQGICTFTALPMWFFVQLGCGRPPETWPLCWVQHGAGHLQLPFRSRWSGRGQVDWSSESSDFSSLRFGFPTLRRILISHRDAVGWKKTPGTQEAPKDCIISSSPQWQLTRPAAGPQDAPQNSSQEQRLTVLGEVLLSL